MATCRHCAYLRKCIEKATKEGYEHNVDFDASSGCPNFGFKSNTNADRIRAMSDEELAEMLGWKCLCDYIPVHASEHCEKYKRCKDCLVEWLKQPADRGEEE